jgi:hypothetical protein
LEAFGAFYTQLWASYGFYQNFTKKWNSIITKKIFLKIHEILPKVKRFTKSGHTVRELVQLIMPIYRVSQKNAT